MIAFTFAVALLALAAVQGVPQEAPAPRLSTAAPDKRIELDFLHYYSPEELSAALGALSAAYPEYLRVETIGASRSGRPIQVAVLGDSRGGELERRPALCLVAGLCESDFAGTEMVLATLCDLLQNRARDPRIAELFERAVVYAVPCVDPDRRARLLAEVGAAPAEAAASAEPARAVELDLNFPSGWDPWSERSGPYPLSAPEVRALVEFLGARSNVQVLLCAGAGEPGGAARTDLPEADRAAYSRVSDSLGAARGALAVCGADQSALARGSLGEYAVQELGAFVFRAAADAAGEAPPAGELYDLGRRFSQVAVALGSGLARTSLSLGEVVRLKSDLWQVDVRVQSEGVLPAISALGRAHRVPCGFSVATQGGRLVAAALRTGSDGEFRAEGLAPERLFLPPIDAGEGCTLRLIVEASSDSELALELARLRGGTARLTVPLK